MMTTTPTINHYNNHGSDQVSIDSDGKPKCRLGVGFLQVEKSYTDEVQHCKDIKDSFGPEKLA